MSLIEEDAGNQTCPKHPRAYSLMFRFSLDRLSIFVALYLALEGSSALVKILPQALGFRSPFIPLHCLLLVLLALTPLRRSLPLVYLTSPL